MKFTRVVGLCTVQDNGKGKYANVSAIKSEPRWTELNNMNKSVLIGVH